jgi:hypothetical protein
VIRNLFAVSILLLVGSDRIPANQATSRTILTTGVLSDVVSRVLVQEDSQRGWSVLFQDHGYPAGKKPSHPLSSLSLGAWLLLSDGSALTPTTNGTMTITGAESDTDTRVFSYAAPRAGAALAAVVLRINDQYHIRPITGLVAQ